MVEILWTDTAKRALRELPERTQQDILRRVEQLSLFPFLGPQMARRWAKYRQLLVGDYRVIYQVSFEGDTVVIVYLRHQRRRL
ncbi:MAG: type II toxin-antitoxin system RelE/ParE family toxin [Chloroflexi bacterium]|nr:type II toxin-antitoxin system RelE/ParE family toxin [Chloroflexota bacterium]